MSVWFPMLPLDLYRRRQRRSGARPDESLVLLVETQGQRQVVVCACHRSRAAGIGPGMPLSTARAALGPAGVIVERHDERRTAEALRGLAVWCHRFSPVVAHEIGHGLSLDITGCDHLFGGERQMIHRIRQGLGRLGFTARIAIAPTYAGARAVVRYGPSDAAIIQPRDLKAALRDLPIEALDASAETSAGLAEVSVRTIGGLMDLPRASVAARFDPAVLSALDRALGRAPEFIEPVRPVKPPSVDQLFEGPSASLQAIGLACRTLIERLCAALATRECGVTEWCATLKRSDLGPLEIRLRQCAASRDARHLWHLLEPRLERAHLGFGVEGVAITALRTSSTGHAQQSLWRDPEADDLHVASVDTLIDTLVNRLGDQRVLRAGLCASRVPERAVVMRSAILKQHKGSAELCEGDRPTRLFEQPPPARVIALSPDGPVSHIQWRGASRQLVACVGPERITGEWWDARPCSRDYFKVQCADGQWLWLCHDHRADAWFVHGVWE